jgi:hypothetical protein
MFGESRTHTVEMLERVISICSYIFDVELLTQLEDGFSLQLYLEHQQHITLPLQISNDHTPEMSSYLGPRKIVVFDH